MMFGRLHRFFVALKNLQHMPAVFRMAYELVEAQADVARQDFRAAERRLVRIYDMHLPRRALERSPADLLMALVFLRLGNPEAAAKLAPDAVRQVGSIRKWANPIERAYLRYAGRLIFEEATDQLGAPMTLDVGVDYEDLDIERVSSSFRDAFPVYRSRYAAAPQAH